MGMQERGSCLVRPASRGEAAQVAELIRAAFEEYRDVLDPPSGALAETEKSVREKMEKGGALIAFLGSAAVGCCLWRLDPEHLYVGRLAVLPEFRGTGVGGLLLRHVEEKAARSGPGRVQIMVRSALGDLLRYYEKRGYQIVREGAHPGYSQATYVVMEKGIAPGRPGAR